VTEVAGSIVIEGHYASAVLGTFRIIRGFATLQELAEISVPYEMAFEEAGGGGVQGYQRAIYDSHAEDIKRYLEAGNLRFLPEIILSIRSDFSDELDDLQNVVGVLADAGDGLRISRRWKRAGLETHQIRLKRDAIPRVVHEERRIRRIDGNHRLHLAASLKLDEHVPTKYLAPFCAVLLGPPGDQNDDYVESMLFHTINSTAIPLDSEHALALILGQPAGMGPSADEEFAGSPPLHLTRLLKTSLGGLPELQQKRLGKTPITALYSAARTIISMEAELATDREALDALATDLYAALVDVLARMPASVPELCRADFFVELASLAWEETRGGAHEERINQTVASLDALGRWLGRDGLDQLHDGQSLAQQLFELYLSVRRRIPRRVFLARWYPKADDGEEKARADMRLDMIRRTLDDLRAEGIDLELDDPGTEEGDTFPIHQEMYAALGRSDIILLDLSGVRPNVCIEAGYALDHHDERHLLFIFQPTSATPNNPAHDRPPFDLGGTFRYEGIKDAAEIPDKIKGHIRAIIQAAENGE